MAWSRSEASSHAPLAHIRARSDTLRWPRQDAKLSRARVASTVRGTGWIPGADDSTPTPPKAATPSREAKAAVTAHAHQRRRCARSSVFGAMGRSGEVWSGSRRTRQWQSREHSVQQADGRAGWKRCGCALSVRPQATLQGACAILCFELSRGLRNAPRDQESPSTELTGGGFRFCILFLCFCAHLIR